MSPQPALQLTGLTPNTASHNKTYTTLAIRAEFAVIKIPRNPIKDPKYKTPIKQSDVYAIVYLHTGDVIGGDIRKPALAAFEKLWRDYGFALTGKGVYTSSAAGARQTITSTNRFVIDRSIRNA